MQTMYKSTVSLVSLSRIGSRVSTRQTTPMARRTFSHAWRTSKTKRSYDLRLIIALLLRSQNQPTHVDGLKHSHNQHQISDCWNGCKSLSKYICLMFWCKVLFLIAKDM